MDPVGRLFRLAVCAALAAWGLGFIVGTSFEIGGTRYFSLFDDAMISMTYARNLVEGHGLNWARFGEPVEGFTSPLWTLAMVMANLGGIALRWRPLIVQLSCLAILLGALHKVPGALPAREGRAPLAACDRAVRELLPA